jgi:hypothetical protein
VEHGEGSQPCVSVAVKQPPSSWRIAEPEIEEMAFIGECMLKVDADHADAR